MVSQHDRDILRELARKVRDLALHPDNLQLKELWYAHNELKSKRPMILCFPEGATGECMASTTMQCDDKNLHWIEWSLRWRIYQTQVLRDDSPIEPFFDVGWNIEQSNFGIDIPMQHGDNRGSYKWEPVLKDLDHDLDKLKFREFKVDRDKTQHNRQLAHDLIGDILPVRIRGMLWWTCGLTWSAALLMGIEEIMMSVYDNPAGLHRLMAFLSEDQRRFIQWTQDEQLLTPNDENGYTGSGGVAYSRELHAKTASHPTTQLSDLWGFAESQETVGMSPDHFAEFILPYQIPLLEKFGLNCYGCCEQLETRIDVVLNKVPRLRRISVAPLANQKALAQKIVGKYIFSRKPDPTKVCVGFDEPGIRNELRETLQLAGHGPLELIMKDTHTVQNQPWRLAKWVQIAREEVDRYLAKA